MNPVTVSSEWRSRYQGRRRHFFIVAAAFFILIMTKTLWNWHALPAAVHSGSYGCGVNIILVRDNSVLYGTVFMQYKRCIAGLYARLNTSMSFRSHDNKAAIHEFKILQGDIILPSDVTYLNYPQIDQSVFYFMPSDWVHLELPTSTLIGWHTVQTDTLTSKAYLRPVVLFLLFAICVIILCFLIGSIAADTRRLRRFARGRCPKCAYPLLEGELVTCPECGLRILREDKGPRGDPSTRG